MCVFIFASMGKHVETTSSMTWVRMTMFGLFFTSMMLLLNYYNFVHFRIQFGPIPDLVFWPLFLFMAFSMMIAWALSFYSDSRSTQGFYFFAMVWLGFSVILIIVLIAHDVVTRFITIDTMVTVKFIIGFVAILTVVGMVNALFIRTTTIALKAKGLERDLRVVQLSDIHMGVDHGVKFMRKLVDKVNSLSPDLILITGDLIDGPFKCPESHFAPLKRLKAPTYLSTGNHEFMVGMDVTSSIVRKVGIKLLRNEGVDLANNVQLLAVDDAWVGGMLIEEVLERVRPDPKRYTILMSHQPRGFEVAAEKGVDLMLSGHTHGGQLFPMTCLIRLVYRQGKGLYRSKGSVLYTTTGTGTWGPPIRLGTNSEVVLFKLKAK